MSRRFEIIRCSALIAFVMLITTLARVFGALDVVDQITLVHIAGIPVTITVLIFLLALAVILMCLGRIAWSFVSADYY